MHSIVHTHEIQIELRHMMIIFSLCFLSQSLCFAHMSSEIFSYTLEAREENKKIYTRKEDDKEMQRGLFFTKITIQLYSDKLFSWRNCNRHNSSSLSFFFLFLRFNFLNVEKIF